MNVMSVLKAEISRLAKKEAKAVVAPVKKASSTYRALIASLRKQLDSLQKEVSSLKRAVPAPEKVLAKEPKGRFWMTGQGVRTLRKRLGLTQSVFGKLAGVSNAAVVNWESHKGKINFRKATAGALKGLRGKGKREIAEILAKAPKAKAKAKKKA